MIATWTWVGWLLLEFAAFVDCLVGVRCWLGQDVHVFIVVRVEDWTRTEESFELLSVSLLLVNSNLILIVQFEELLGEKSSVNGDLIFVFWKPNWFVRNVGVQVVRPLSVLLVHRVVLLFFLVHFHQLFPFLREHLLLDFDLLIALFLLGSVAGLVGVEEVEAFLGEVDVQEGKLVLFGLLDPNVLDNLHQNI